MVEKLMENLNKEQLEGILKAIPIDISFVDENDIVKFWNKHETRVLKHPLAVVGKSVRDCHPQKSVHEVGQVLSDLKSN